MIRLFSPNILIVLLTGISFTLSAQNTLNNLGLTAAEPSAAAFSLRRLSSAYAGSAIQVRRSSDNGTQDIGFTASGDLDEAALLTFIGANSGFITIWYDQSGNGRNATQTTIARQPRIVNAGVVDKQNSRASIVFSGAQNLTTSLTGVHATTSGNITTVNFVLTQTTANSSIISNADGGTNRYNIHSPWGDGVSYFDIGDINSGGRISANQTWGSYSISTFLRNGAVGEAWRNGNNFMSRSSFATTVTSTNTMFIGSINATTNFITGTLGELIIFPSALSTSARNTLESNQSTYYSITLAQALTLNNLGLPSTVPAAGAFSLRRLSSAYAGSAIQVRRSSDNAIQDIGFTAGGDLDQTALLTFVGASSGFVSVWYDQSGFGRHAVQATQGTQPRIVNAGVTETRNGRPSLVFSGGQTMQTSITANQATTGGNISTANFVGQNAVTNSSIISNDAGGNRYNIHASWGDGVTYFDIGNATTGQGRLQATLAWADYSVGTFQRNVANNQFWKNGVSRASGNTASSTVTSSVALWIGSQTGTSQFIDGYLSEVLLFPSAISTADRTTLECGQSTYYSIPFEAAQGIDAYISNTATTSACAFMEEQVVWQQSSLNFVNASRNNLIKFQSGGNWDGGAASLNTVNNNGYLAFIATENNTARMIGLSNVNVNTNFSTIQFAWYLRSNGNTEVYESGSLRGSFGAYASNDIFKITVESNVVKYYRNGILQYISSVTPTLPLLVDVSVYSFNGSVTDAVVANPYSGTFTANVTGTTPSNYQWRVNGGAVGSNSSTYTNTTLSTHDVVTCDITYTGVCNTTTFTTNSITNLLIPNPENIVFFITGSQASTACNAVEEQVTWRLGDLVNVSANNNNLLKIQSGGNWDGGAASWNTVANNGFMQFTATETNTARMVGLSTNNTNSSFATIQYAWYLRSNGNLEIYESNNLRATFGAYATNDVFKIAVEANVVKYYRNGTLQYISALTPTLPLLVDVSINSLAGTVTNAIVSNYNQGVFTATTANVGAAPTFQWKLNGSNVGTNSATYANVALLNNAVVTCVLTPSLAGCTALNAYTSNTAINKTITAPTGIDFYISGTQVVTACNTVDEQVKWRVSDLVNVEATNNNLLKIQSGGNWDGGAASWNTVTNNGYMQFTATETNTARMVGLSSTNTNSSFATIQYAWYLRSNGNLEIYESNNLRGTFGAYATNDIFKIAVEANVVKYYRNGTLQYISAVTPTLPLLVDVSINSLSGTVTNALVSNYNQGAFTATTVNAGAAPTFQWKLNGGNVGTNSASYTNTALANNDVVTCVLTPDAGGCSLSNSFTSNIVTNKPVSVPTSIDVYATGIVSSTACIEAIEQVVWRISDLTNVQATGNNLLKVQSGGNWNGGAASWNTVANNGYLLFTATETTTARMVGLSNTNTNASFNSIQYAWYLRSNGNFEIYESGNLRATFGAYATNDEFKITVENSVVKYYRNDVWQYTSAVSPTLPLLVDASINTVPGTVTNARVVNNSNAGVFTVTTTNVGTNPTYQWKLNGGNVGTNSQNYINTGIVPGDAILVTVTPDLGGCSTTSYASNTITVNGPGATTTWTGTTSTAWYTTSNWSNGVPNRFKAATIPSGTTFSPSITNEANVYDITIANGATLTITASNQLYVYRNFTNNGSFVRNTSRVHFVGCSSASQIDCAGTQTFHNVTVNSAFPVNVASGTTQVSGNFAFTSGIVNQNASLQFLAGSTATGASNTSYVDGVVRKIGNTSFTFPVGDNGFYRSIGISAPSNVAHFFDAQYFNTDHNLGTPVNWDPTFWTVTGCEYWNLTRNGGTSSNVSVTLSWNEAACNPGYVTTPLDLRVTQWNGTNWTNQGNSGITGTATLGTLTSGAAVTTYGPFTLASATSLNPLPVELLYFIGNLTEDNQVLLEWKTATEVNNHYFSIERSFNGIDFDLLKEVPGSGTQQEPKEYSLIDERVEFSSKVYYRLSQTDLDGTRKALGIVRLFVHADAMKFVVYPNPSSQQELTLQGKFGYRNTAQLVDMLGNVVNAFEWTGKSSEVKLNIGNLPAGNYLLRIQTSEGITAMKRIVLVHQ